MNAWILSSHPKFLVFLERIARERLFSEEESIFKSDQNLTVGSSIRGSNFYFCFCGTVILLLYAFMYSNSILLELAFAVFSFTFQPL